MTLVATRSLADCEAVIEAGLGTFVEVGEALLAIRDGRLYREAGYARFEDYTRERWGMSHRHANRTIEAAEVAGLVGPMGPTVNERQARELVPVLRDFGAATVAEVVAETAERTDGRLTAAAIRETIRGRLRSEASISEQELVAATDSLTDAQRQAYSPEASRQRGELTRLVGDLAALPDPAEFIHEHRRYVAPRTVENAERAHAWLSDFLTEWRSA